MRTWDPKQPGQWVCLRDNPGRRGRATGKIKQAGSFVLVEVDFGANQKEFKRYDLLILVDEEDGDVIDLIRAGRFGNQADLRRVLTFEKTKGELTNIFYSMESSNTDFYAHQFKPVMSFIESPVGRLLIADEVGLGKTIEATFIWKEIQARQAARRLLIVCPAMLREKWRSDLRQRFNISGEIVNAKQLFDRLREVADGAEEEAFVYIVSLESIGPPADFEEAESQATRVRLAQLLERNAASEHFALIDYVIVDEAHKLRNPSTGNHRIARLLRDASRHMVLLTATPIQLGSDNLYQLLRLVDPDVFFDAQLFSQILGANAHIVRAQRALWRQRPDLANAKAAVEDALRTDYFRGDLVLERVLATLSEPSINNAQRVETVRLLETRSLLSLYMTRSRKREVLESRVARASQVPYLSFSPSELALYDHVTERIRTKARGLSGASLFALISRQRQMASSIVGALESWDEKGITDELLWEDGGFAVEADDAAVGDAVGDVGDVAFGVAFDIKELERVDAKYGVLRDLLKDQLSNNPHEKFVVFAYFRGTLKYLHRRLKADGIRSSLLMGGMSDEKEEVIADFAERGGASVLLSSEVGSEGIDLQFCRFVVNYDLPWNPMRIEQRIGRLDRLGQRAERIAIVNLAVSNTIEDRILLRLYERINVFRESIGDLEEILGDMTEELLWGLLDPNLSDEERDRRAMDTELAIANRRQQQEVLEREAVNLVGFSDYILNNITESREQGRWLSPDELIAFAEDFFAVNYPGTTLKPGGDTSSRIISLSEEAQRALAGHIEATKPSTRTRLHRESVLCLFDPRGAQKLPPGVEVVGPTHPLIQWVREFYQNSTGTLHALSALRLASKDCGLSPGDYVYCAQRWAFEGLKSEAQIAFCAVPIGSDLALTAAESESLVFGASRRGRTLPNAQNNLGDLEMLHAMARECEHRLDERMSERFADFLAENDMRCQQQETSAKKYARRRIDGFEARVVKFERSGKLQLIPMTRGLIAKEEEHLKDKLSRIERYRSVSPTVATLAAGVIRVE